MTKPNLRQLRATAGAATPGPWTLDASTWIRPGTFSNYYQANIAKFQYRKDGKHIAACDPQTILSLLDVIRIQNEALKSANDMCRSASQIGRRLGAKTNWSGFNIQISESLQFQSETLAQVGELIELGE